MRKESNVCCGGYAASTEAVVEATSVLAQKHPDWSEARLRQRAYVEVMLAKSTVLGTEEKGQNYPH